MAATRHARLSLSTSIPHPSLLLSPLPLKTAQFIFVLNSFNSADPNSADLRARLPRFSCSNFFDKDMDNFSLRKLNFQDDADTPYFFKKNYICCS